MIADGLINAADVSVTTFQRFIKKNSLKGTNRSKRNEHRIVTAKCRTGRKGRWVQPFRPVSFIFK